MSSPFGDWLTEQMKAGGDSLADVGSAVGLARQTVWDIKKGRQQPSVETAVRLARYYRFNAWSVLRFFDLMPADAVRTLMDAKRVDPETGT